MCGASTVQVWESSTIGSSLNFEVLILHTLCSVGLLATIIHSL
jgi:hypothetical protein